MNNEFDVAVVGAGPGGSAAAKKCVEGGLRTLLLEKHRLPRNKVCTGMIMSEASQTLVRDEFGDPPEGVLTRPPHLLGIKFRAPAAETITFEHRMPFAWRKDFDYWLNQVAETAGVELWHKAHVKGIVEETKSYILSVQVGDETRLIRARFLIGADGTLSVVRKALFPEVAMSYQLAVRQCYQGSLDLDPEYVHYFYLPDLTGFEINFKDDLFLLEMTPRPDQGDGSDIVRKAEAWLAQDFGFTPRTKPLWRDGCFEPSMGRKPFSGPSPLAKGNGTLVGNAAGLVKPITGEGIGTALKSGLMAAEAVIQADKKGERADKFYLPMAEEMVSTLGSLYPPHGKIREEAKRGTDCFLVTLKEIFSRITGIL